MFYLHRILMVLMAVRLLMPPGICACKWSAPAAQFLVQLLQTDRQIPPPPDERFDPDHAPGCPASPLAVGMGLLPASQPAPSLTLSFDPPPPLETGAPSTLTFVEDAIYPFCASPDAPRYLTLRTLLI